MHNEKYADTRHSHFLPLKCIHCFINFSFIVLVPLIVLQRRYFLLRRLLQTPKFSRQCFIKSSFTYAHLHSIFFFSFPQWQNYNQSFFYTAFPLLYMIFIPYPDVLVGSARRVPARPSTKALGGLWQTDARLPIQQMSSSKRVGSMRSVSSEIRGFSARTTFLAAAGSVESRRQ